MERRPLGNSDIEISPVGFGAWAVGGGGWWGGYGSQDDHESLAALRKALELGINWIDTAPVYGKGHSETVVGRFLAGLREAPLVFTKCGLSWNDADDVVVDLRPETIRKEVDESLRRLGVEVIDLLQVHWPEEPEDDRGDLERAWSTLADLRQAGKVRWIGASNFGLDHLERARPIAPVTSLQPPYSLIKREIEDDVLPYCAEHDIGVLAYSPMASGLLSGSMSAERAARLAEDDWRRGDPNFTEPLLSRNLAVAKVVRRVATRHGTSEGVVAVAWALRDPVVTGAIVGFRRPEHVSELVAAGELRLGAEDLVELDEASSAVTT